MNYKEISDLELGLYNIRLYDQEYVCMAKLVNKAGQNKFVTIGDNPQEFYAKDIEYIKKTDEPSLDKGNHDLSDIKVGDFIATVTNGWTKVINVREISGLTTIETRHGVFKVDGRAKKHDTYPIAYKVPPAWLLEKIGPKPNKNHEIIDNFIVETKKKLETVSGNILDIKISITVM